MLIDLLTNNIGVDLTEVNNFSSTDVAGKMSQGIIFKYYSRIYSDYGKNDNIYDRESYICLNESLEAIPNLVSQAIKYMKKNMYINKYPQRTQSPINRFITKFSLILDIELINTFMETLRNTIIKENIPNNSQVKFYILAMFNTCNQLIGYINGKSNYMKCLAFIDIYDSIINSSYSGFFSKTSKYPILTTNSISSTSKMKDVQINFSDKVDGIVHASFNINPFMVNVKSCGETITYDSEDGNVLKIGNDSISVEYVGSITRPELIYNYSEFRSKLVFKFVPEKEGRKIYKTKEEFDQFNELIKYIENGVYGSLTKFLKEIPVKLESIEIINSGSRYIEPADIMKSIISDLLIDINYDEKFNYLVSLLNNEQSFNEALIRSEKNHVFFINENLPSFQFGALFYK